MRIAYVNIDAMVDIELTRAQWQVFWTIVKFIDLETGLARVSTKELSELLGRKPANISLELRKLIDDGLIHRRSIGILIVNPELVWREQ